MNETLESARELIGKGYLVSLLKEKAHRFKNPQPMSIVDIRYWVTRETPLNLGLWLKGSGLCVLDCDSESALAEVERRGWVGMIGSVTRRGIQYLFRLPPEVKEPRNRIGFLPQTDLICNN